MSGVNSSLADAREKLLKIEENLRKAAETHIAPIEENTNVASSYKDMYNSVEDKEGVRNNTPSSDTVDFAFNKYDEVAAKHEKSKEELEVAANKVKSLVESFFEKPLSDQLSQNEALKKAAEGVGKLALSFPRRRHYRE